MSESTINGWEEATQACVNLAVRKLRNSDIDVSLGVNGYAREAALLTRVALQCTGNDLDEAARMFGPTASMILREIGKQRPAELSNSQDAMLMVLALSSERVQERWEELLRLARASVSNNWVLETTIQQIARKWSNDTWESNWQGLSQALLNISQERGQGQYLRMQSTLQEAEKLRHKYNPAT